LRQNLVFKLVITLLGLIFPWRVRRVILNFGLGYSIHRTARIGFSIIVPDYLEMGPNAQIGHFNTCKGLKEMIMGQETTISTMNWITGLSIREKKFFKHRKDRDPSLYLGDHSAITNRHYIDCTDRIRVGKFTTIAGIGSQFLTHSINLLEAHQDCTPISIGDYCFVGTNCVFLPGSSLGNYSVLSASSLLNRKFSEEYILIGGIPARPIKELPKDMGYFRREKGFIN